MAPSRTALRLVLLLVVGWLAFAPAARAEGPSIDEVLSQAESLLDKADYARARELLESAARRIESGPRKKRARMFALLGRARAETGDASGMNEAFVTAVELDIRVRLDRRKTSPKILDALEQARKNARPPPKPETAEPAPKPKPKPKPQPKPKAKAKPEPKSKAKARAPAPPKTKPAPTPPKVESGPPLAPSPTPGPAGPSNEPQLGPPALSRMEVIGPVVPLGRVKLQITVDNVPPWTEVRAHLKRAKQPTYLELPMTRTGTIAELMLRLDEEPMELYFQAKDRGEAIASLGSPDEPLVLTPGQLPTIQQAWQTTGSSTVAVAQTDLGPAEEIDWAPIAFAGALAVGLGIALFVVLSSGSSPCEAEQGFGCVEVQILPLTRW